MKRRNLIPLTFLLLAPALVAGAAKPEDMPVQEDDWITATAGGKKDNAQIVGCGSKTLEDGYIVAKCTDACTSKFWRWRFWVTKYNVSGTIRAGEHQGIRIYGAEYKFDKRFLAEDGDHPQPWKAGKNTTPFLERILDPENEDVSKYALCKFTNVIETKINNHGRSLATRKSSSNLDENIEGPPIKSLGDHVIGPLDYAQWSGSDDSVSGKSDSGKAAHNITQCLKNILDGYCDSVCANCSYVLPLLTGGKKTATDPFVEDIGPYPGQATNWTAKEGTRYVKYTNPGTYVIDLTIGGVTTTLRTFNDDFTHCVMPGAGPQQSLILASPSSLKGVVSGLFGHNSNTDAEAEFRQFEACIKDPSVGKRKSCGKCGKDRFNSATKQTEQWPCANITNTATLTWSESADSGDMETVDDSNLGGPSIPPLCLSSGKLVNGM